MLDAVNGGHIDRDVTTDAQCIPWSANKISYGGLCQDDHNYPMQPITVLGAFKMKAIK